jgi:hypothetical protein
MQRSCWGMREDHSVSHLVWLMTVQTVSKRNKNRANLLKQLISKTMGRKMAKTAPKTWTQSEAMPWRPKAMYPAWARVLKRVVQHKISTAWRQNASWSGFSGKTGEHMSKPRSMADKHQSTEDAMARDAFFVKKWRKKKVSIFAALLVGAPSLVAIRS